MATVLVAGHKNSTDRVYHTDPDCRAVTNKHNEWDRDTAESWDIPPCKYCCPEAQPAPNTTDRSLHQKFVALGNEYEQTGKDPLQQS